jgi:hypothetical protein
VAREHVPGRVIGGVGGGPVSLRGKGAHPRSLAKHSNARGLARSAAADSGEHGPYCPHQRKLKEYNGNFQGERALECASPIICPRSGLAN